MSTTFSDIPVRVNGTRILVSWFNLLRTAGINILGSGAIAETQFTIANNQTSVADVTGLTFSKTLVRGAEILFSARRQYGATDLTEFGTIKIVYNETSDSWQINNDSVGDAGLTFTITAAGQIQYTSTDIGGATVSAMRFRANTLAQEA